MVGKLVGSGGPPLGSGGFPLGSGETPPKRPGEAGRSPGKWGEWHGKRGDPRCSKTVMLFIIFVIVLLLNDACHVFYMFFHVRYFFLYVFNSLCMSFIFCMKLYDNPMILHVCMKMLNLVKQNNDFDMFV